MKIISIVWKKFKWIVISIVLLSLLLTAYLNHTFELISLSRQVSLVCDSNINYKYTSFKNDTIYIKFITDNIFFDKRETNTTKKVIFAIQEFLKNNPDYFINKNDTEINLHFKCKLMPGADCYIKLLAENYNVKITEYDSDYIGISSELAVLDLSSLETMKFLGKVDDITIFKDLNNLKYLELNAFGTNGSSIKDDDVIEIHKMLPNCEISYNPQGRVKYFEDLKKLDENH